MTVKFAIPTVSHYLDKTLPVVISSLLQNGILKDDIHVFVNDSTENKDDIVEGIHYHYNIGMSYFEWICPKLIIEKNLESEWWFLCHDTIKFGENFSKLFTEFMKNNTSKSVKLSPTLSNSIGLVHSDIFHNHSQFFTAKFNEIDAITDILERKRWCIQNENQYLQLEPYAHFQNDEPHMIWSKSLGYAENEQPYGVIRNEEYYHGIDLIKYKKNSYGYAAVQDVNL